MGVIQRQGLKASIWMYLGVALGFLNGTILYPRLVGLEVYGFINWLFPTVTVIAIIAGLGVKSGLIRFFPYFRSAEARHNGFLGLALLVAHAGFLLVLSSMWLFEDTFRVWFQNEQNAAFLDKHFQLVPLLLLITLWFEVLSAYLTALLRPSITLFFKDLLARVFTTGLIFCYYFNWINIDQFIQLIVGKQLLLVLGLVVYIWRMKEWHLRINWPAYKRDQVREMTRYNSFTIFSGIGNQLTNRVDSIMIPALINFTANGIYAIYYFISTIIIMPHMAVSQIAMPLFSEYWKNNDLAEIKALFQRTALANYAVALLLYIGILANLDNAILLIGEQIRPARSVAIWLGAAQLIHVIHGYNGNLLSLSERYRWHLSTTLFTGFLAALTNYFLIKAYGIIGAGIATAITVIISNLTLEGVIYSFYRLHPYSLNMLKLSLLGGLIYFGQNLLAPMGGHFLTDVVIRSILIAAVYGLIVLRLRWVPDLNDWLDSTIKKYR